MMKSYDLIVCGGGLSGCVSAISARRLGLRVLLVESSGILGGSTTQSLVSPWMTFYDDGKQISKGIGEEIVRRLKNNQQSLGHIKDPIGFTDRITPVDIEGVKQVLIDYMIEEEIDVLFHAFIYDVIKDNHELKAIKVMTKAGSIDLFGGVFVDATGDGDVAFLSNAPFQIGRESDKQTQPMTMMFHLGGVDTKTIKTYIESHKDEFVLDDTYDEDYLAVSGFFNHVIKAKEQKIFSIPRDRVLLFQEIRENEVSINMTRLTGYNALDPFSFSSAEIEARKQVKEAFNFLKKEIPGFKEAYLLRTPSRLGVRETRHIFGEYLLTKEDVIHRQTFEDSIAVASFPIDIHSPSGDGLTFYEQERSKSYEIPLRVMIPKEVEGLIVTGRCVSATHEANASLRVSASVMALGEAAGILASLTIKEKKRVRNVNYQQVQSILRERKQPFKIKRD
ncbi:MAG: FAD-dependent oxidoreductase [Acholeplasma sp.]|nr:FAD-dependent oxidoreductase [Acholeplasma sp.]